MLRTVIRATRGVLAGEHLRAAGLTYVGGAGLSLAILLVVVLFTPPGETIRRALGEPLAQLADRLLAAPVVPDNPVPLSTGSVASSPAAAIASEGAPAQDLPEPSDDEDAAPTTAMPSSLESARSRPDAILASPIRAGPEGPAAADVSGVATDVRPSAAGNLPRVVPQPVPPAGWEAPPETDQAASVMPAESPGVEPTAVVMAPRSGGRSAQRPSGSPLPAVAFGMSPPPPTRTPHAAGTIPARGALLSTPSSPALPPAVTSVAGAMATVQPVVRGRVQTALQTVPTPALGGRVEATVVVGALASAVTAPTSVLTAPTRIEAPAAPPPLPPAVRPGPPLPPPGVLPELPRLSLPL